MNIIKSALYKYWKFRNFIGKQEVVINSIIDGNNTLVSLPTGGGKSLCYQLPSTIIKGTTFVISPLISLMEDQVYKMNKIGISSFYFKSEEINLSIDKQIDNLIYGNYRLVYCSPERLNSSLLNLITILSLSLDDGIDDTSPPGIFKYLPFI